MNHCECCFLYSEVLAKKVTVSLYFMWYKIPLQTFPGKHKLLIPEIGIQERFTVFTE